MPADPCRIELVHLCVALECAVPHQRDTREIRFKDDAVQPWSLVSAALAIGKTRLEVQRHHGQRKIKTPEWAQIKERDRLAADEKLCGLLVNRRTLKKAIVAVIRQQWLARLLPRFVISAGQRRAGLPMAGDRTEPRRCRSILPCPNRPFRGLDIRDRLVGQMR